MQQTCKTLRVLNQPPTRLVQAHPSFYLYPIATLMNHATDNSIKFWEKHYNAMLCNGWLQKYRGTQNCNIKALVDCKWIPSYSLLLLCTILLHHYYLAFCHVFPLFHHPTFVSRIFQTSFIRFALTDPLVISGSFLSVQKLVEKQRSVNSKTNAYN